jgi:hypothetical protein
MESVVRIRDAVNAPFGDSRHMSQKWQLFRHPAQAMAATRLNSAQLVL